jgi:hypothetical protein
VNEHPLQDVLAAAEVSPSHSTGLEQVSEWPFRSLSALTLEPSSAGAPYVRRVRGERAQLSPEEEWPPVADYSPEAWRETQHTLEQLNQQLESAVREFPAEGLSQELGSEYSAYIQFCGTP